MPRTLPADSSLLILLNPGRQSRHYLLGLAAGAQRIGLPCFTLELGPIWQATAGAERLGAARRRVLDLVRLNRITHTLGYIFNGTHDLGVGEAPGERPRTLWDEAGIRHSLLWTDHPEWAVKGCALDPPLAGLLGGAQREHILKSPAAAEEAGAVLRWPGVRSMPMAEDYAALRPARGVEPVHDAVAIVGDAGAPPNAALPFLADDDPDPRAIDRCMRPHAERAWLKVVGPGYEALMSAWLDARQSAPGDSFWRLARTLQPAHADSLAWLAADPRRWYTAVQALRRMTGWRRNFWLAWLGRRVDLGLYGSPAAALGIPQRPEAGAWVPYEQQAEVYARGRAAININAPHDEEGLTHKPFQAAAAGAPCIHHATRGLEDCFSPGTEVLTFQRGPELLDAVRSLADRPRREALGAAFRARALRDHTWEHRLTTLLAEPEHRTADVRVPIPAAA